MYLRPFADRDSQSVAELLFMREELEKTAAKGCRLYSSLLLDEA
ncbi:hypothetical protein DFP78_102626 [Photobacterium lutimaris]|nr:hypothetical protein DFP78_102626 [Photobacterium lutimaris]